MATVTLKSLLEAGVHFGHRTKRWNPKMRPYIFTERNGVHIIDLQQTVAQLEKAKQFAQDIVADGGSVLFVGTKRQAADIIVTEAERCEMPYVNKRWLGGTLTNFQTIRTRVDHMVELERRRDYGEFARLPKIEVLKLHEEIERLNLRVGGLRNMQELPDALFIVDVRREDLAVREAIKLDIPIVAVVDTNCDPDPVEIVIPSNDDAIRTIKLMTSQIADSIVEGSALRETRLAEEEEEEPITIRSRTSRADMVFDSDSSIDELLGPSTLAKLEEGIGSDEEEIEPRRGKRTAKPAVEVIEEEEEEDEVEEEEDEKEDEYEEVEDADEDEGEDD
ncbi:MAG: 30S ribosomal protein S2 [Caldilineales bacterium]|nr:30S ribosomal protein S2 [Caldilineales bacterium]